MKKRILHPDRNILNTKNRAYCELVRNLPSGPLPALSVRALAQVRAGDAHVFAGRGAARDAHARRRGPGGRLLSVSTEPVQ